MDTNAMTRAYNDSILIEERLLDSVLPDTTLEFLGEKFDSPLMTPAFSHLPHYHDREENGLVEYSRAAKNCKIVNFCGMMENDAYAEIAATDARTIRIIKPYADRDKVFDQIAFAQAHGALAVGVDIDHVFGKEGYDVVRGEAMTDQPLRVIKEYVASTSLPFVIKGVLSVQDAVKCAQAGVQVIVVSHHHGIMPYAVPPLMILPRIKKALAGTGVKILVDCSIDRGADVFKALALGADGASVGRAMTPFLEEGGVAGMEQCIRNINGELKKIMAFTGAKDLHSIDPSVLWINGKPYCAD